MSLGYGAGCRKAAEDNKTLIYEYSVYNWNMKECKSIYDGIILIDKEDISYQIDNCSQAWCLTEDGIDVMAKRLIFKLLRVYEKQGIFADEIVVAY